MGEPQWLWRRTEIHGLLFARGCADMAVRQLCAGIDIGGSAAKIGLVAPDGSIVRQTSIPTVTHSSPRELLDSQIQVVIDWQSSLGRSKLFAVGIGVPGHVTDNHRSTDVCNLKILNRFPIADYVEKETGLPVWIENDADVAGIGEHRFGAGRGSPRFLMATLGSGIGTSFILDGKITVTANGTLGDIGHLIVDKQMRFRCRGGCLGCIESVASGLALARDAQQLAADNPDSYLGRVARSGKPGLSVRDVIQGAGEGDRLCIEKMEDTAHWIGMWTSSVVHIFGPDTLVFGGGWSAAGQRFVDRILHHARSMGVPHYFRQLEARLAILGNKAGFVGAATYAREMCTADRN